MKRFLIGDDPIPTFMKSFPQNKKSHIEKNKMILTMTLLINV